ncbi:MAG: DapH/DapD/GlmU-related protein [Planctomycetota bacterium]|nr:DapH/DapD/GlmU-related protein [Planctomycetota bacterium]
MFRRLLRRLRSVEWLYVARIRARMMYKRRRYGLRRVHRTFLMNGHSVVSRDLIAHEYSFINEQCYIGPGVELGPYVMLGPRVAVAGADHVMDKAGTPIIFAGRPPYQRTVLEADSWVGFGAILMAGVRIGRGAVVAAGAVITRDVPPYEIHGGVPGRKIGERFPDPADRARHEQMLRRPPERGRYCQPLPAD